MQPCERFIIYVILGLLPGLALSTSLSMYLFTQSFSSFQFVSKAPLSPNQPTNQLSRFFVRCDPASSHTHTHNRFMVLFPGPPRWAGARRELLDFIMQGRINRGRHTDHPAGRQSSRSSQCQPPPSPPFLTGRMPFLPPNQQCQSTEGNLHIQIREKTLGFS